MRLFVALELPQNVLDSLEECIGMLSRENRRNDGISWTPRENLHVTVFFIGEVPEHEVVSLEASFEKALSQTPSFYVTIDGFVFLPNKAHPRVIAVLVTEQSGVLRSTYEICDAVCKPYLTLHRKEKFLPHITLGRNKTARPVVASKTQPPHAVFRVDSVVLTESRLYPTGAEYRARKHFSLRYG